MFGQNQYVLNLVGRSGLMKRDLEFMGIGIPSQSKVKQSSRENQGESVLSTW
jgi:hypothetical protein